MGTPLGERFGPDLGERLSLPNYVRPGLPPTLILHGTEDAVVPFSQVKSFVEQMRAVGNRAELFEASGQGHGFFNNSPWLERTLQEVEVFLSSLGCL